MPRLGIACCNGYLTVFSYFLGSVERLGIIRVVEGFGYLGYKFEFGFLVL